MLQICELLKSKELEKLEENDKLQLILESKYVMLDYDIAYNKKIKYWTTCSDKVFRLLANFLNYGIHLEFFWVA